MRLTRSIKLNPYLLLIIPLADIGFLLLLLFVVSSTFLVHPGISVELPFSKFILSTQHHPQIVSITAGPVPTIYFQDQQVTLENLSQKLDRKQTTSEQTIIIRADKEIPQGCVVSVMNLCLEHGYNVVLATSSRSS
jgi:biopolymer transport protein ExbD